MNFDHIFNWRLLEGSHDFPGPDGGTCINEAAIVAAGFEYKAVRSANDCPPCFSRPLSAYLIGINDMLPDVARQQLMRFVMRLSGSVDAPEIERRRAELIALRTVQRILPIALRAIGLRIEADACAQATTLNMAASVARAARAANAAAWAVASAASEAAMAASEAANAAALATARAASAASEAAWAASAAAWAARAASAAAWAAWAASAAAWAARAANAAARAVASAASAAIYQISIEIAEEAFAIGNQATDADADRVAARMDAARHMVRA